MTHDPGALPDRLLVGLGNPYRGDDAVGPLVVQEVARRLHGQAPRLRVIEREEPPALLDLLEGADLAVVVDAVRTGGEPGNLVLLEAGSEAPAQAALPSQAAGLGGTHAFGLASVIDLARVLDRLPRRLVVVGIEAAGFEPGAALSPPVRSAISGCAATIVELLSLGTAADPGEAGS